jgi:AraC-like DNA-binding protein
MDVVNMYVALLARIRDDIFGLSAIHTQRRIRLGLNVRRVREVGKSARNIYAALGASQLAHPAFVAGPVLVRRI